MGKLTDFEREAIRLLREAGVLEDVDAHRIRMDNGVIVIRCPDCDQKDDAEWFDRGIAKANGGSNRMHPLHHHGGAAVAAPGNVLYPDFKIAEYLLLQIKEAEAIKAIHTILAEVHAPCGKGTDAGLTIINLIALMMQGKPDIKAVDPTNLVICRVHVDYGDGVKRTYFISRNKWIEFWDQRGRGLWMHLFTEDPHPPSRTRKIRSPRPVPDREEREDLDQPIVVADGQFSALAGLMPAGGGMSDTLLAIEDAGSNKR